MRRPDQPCAANCCIVFCSFTLRIFAIVPTDMPSSEGSAQRYRRLKMGNLESSKRDHFRPDPVPFDRPLTLDEASETRRDVDVTITVRNLDGSISVFKGIEVKAHSRKLGSEAVEQLTQKMKDMPAITHRVIVSASGFTGPAVKKAKKHGVELYELKEWEPANDFEFFQHELAPAVRTEYGWAQLPSAHLNPSDPIPEGYRAAFRANPVIVFDADNGAVPVRLQEWLISFSKLAAKEAHEHCQSQPGEGIQHLPASVTMRFTDGAWALVGDTRIRVQEV